MARTSRRTTVGVPHVGFTCGRRESETPTLSEGFCFFQSPLSTLPLCFLSLTRNLFEWKRNLMILNTFCGLDKTINLCIMIGREFSTLPPPADSVSRLSPRPPVPRTYLAPLLWELCDLRVENTRGPATKFFICHTSEKSAAKSFPCHTSKNQLPQVLCLPHLRPPPPSRSRNLAPPPAPLLGDLCALCVENTR